MRNNVPNQSEIIQSSCKENNGRLFFQHSHVVEKLGFYYTWKHQLIQKITIKAIKGGPTALIK